MSANAQALNILDLFGAGNSSSLKFIPQGNKVIDTTTVTSCVPYYPPHTNYPPHTDYPPHHTDYPPHSYPPYVTVYTTEYIHVCPTETPCPYGTETKTYSITQTCPNQYDCHRPPIPPNFTTIAKVCNVCEGKPTITVTCPNPVKPTPWGCTGDNCPPKVCQGDNCPKVCTGDNCPKPCTGDNCPKPCDNGDCYKKVDTGEVKYLQANTASSGRTELVSVLLGGFVGIAAWLL